MKMNTEKSLLDIIEYYTKLQQKNKQEYSEKYNNLICPVCNKQLFVLKKFERLYTEEYPVICTYCTSFLMIYNINEEYLLRLITIEEIAELSDDIRNNLIYMRKKYKEIQNV